MLAQRTRLLTIEEVAEYVSMHPESIRRMARQGRLPGRKLGGVWRFRQEDVEEAIFGAEEVDEET